MPAKLASCHCPVDPDTFDPIHEAPCPFVAGVVDESTGLCAACGGVGSRMYGTTGTWRLQPGWIAGSAMTRAVCDICWGSGFPFAPGENLRRSEAQAGR